MDAFDFCKEFNRLCNTYVADSCKGCPMRNISGETHHICLGAIIGINHSDDEWIRGKIKLVEKWSKEHPVKTMAMDFFEKFPNAPKHRDGIPKCCPNVCGYCEDDCAKFGKCGDCWNRHLEE